MLQQSNVSVDQISVIFRSWLDTVSCFTETAQTPNLKSYKIVSASISEGIDRRSNVKMLKTDPSCCWSGAMANA